MGRQEDMIQRAREILTPIFSERVRLLQKDCEEYLETKKEYRKIVFDLISEAQERQAAGKLGQIHYFSVFYLQSSAITESYDFAIALMNERYCLDENGLLLFWCPRCFFQTIDADIRCFEKDARETWIRVRSYELEEIRRAYVNNLYQLAGFFFGEESLSAAVDAGIGRLDCCEEVKFVFGGYMDQAVQFASYRKREKNEVFSA